MKTIDTRDSVNAGGFIDESEWTLIIAAIVVLVISVTVSVLY